jgi:cell division septation protein DedD
MGPLFCKNLSKLTFCVLLISTLFFERTAYASHRELELFDHAYQAYLSYRPEEAVEEFRIFLEEFPDSFAKDAALFWLAKSLLQIKSIEEAKKTFAYVKEQFPESPYSHYVRKEMETLSNVSERLSSVKGTVDVEAGQKLVEAETPVVSEASTDQKTHDADIRSEAARLQELLDGERAKTDFLQRRIKELEQRAAYILNSSIVLDRLGIHDVLWRDKNMFENFETEQALYEQATSHNITTDKQQYRELIDAYQLNEEQADYLKRYLVICTFLEVSNLVDERLPCNPFGFRQSLDRNNVRIFIEDAKRPAYLNAKGAPPEKKASSDKRDDPDKRVQSNPESSEIKSDEKTTAYALQVGAFKTQESAATCKKSLQQKIANKKIKICRQGDFYKVRITGFHDIEEVNSTVSSGVDGLVIRTSEKACGI